ncbi:MAG: S-layer protein, partial [Verrucomicrobiota bacterium]
MIIRRLFRRGLSGLLGFSLLCLFLNNPVSAADRYKVFPEAISLHGSRAFQEVLVCRLEDGLATEAVATNQLTSADPTIARLENGRLIPVADGKTRLTLAVKGETVNVPVAVTGMEKPVPINFRNHVLPILSKEGCNAGACHGALAGKGGFRLSLHGYDPQSDFHHITREARGRRVELSDPGRSLLLTKPTTTVPHKGGKKLESGSPNYQILADWIAAGAHPPSKDDPALTRLEILPEASKLKLGQQQPLIVLAHYSNGRTEDVTRWSKFTSTNETVA